MDGDRQDVHCAKNSFQYCVTWLLGFTTSKRPGSRARTANRTGYLKWRLLLYTERCWVGFWMRLLLKGWMGIV